MDYQIQPRTEAVEKLTDFIKINRLTANTRIPSERDLCQMWGVSRSTLRKAVDILIDQGVLYRVKGSGVYVAPPKKSRNMVGVNAMIDELRQQGISVTKTIISRRTMEATKQIAKKLKIPLGNPVYEYIRIRQVDYVPSVMETSYLDCEEFPGFDERYNEKTSMDYLLKNTYHRVMKSGQEQISVTYASEEEAQLMEIAPDTPLFFTTGVQTEEDGTPLVYYKQLFRADQFKFVSVIE